MKKIITAIILCLVSVTTYAAVMCAEDDAIIIPYGANALSTNDDFWPPNRDVSQMTWRVHTKYGNLMGISTCLYSNGGNSSVHLDTTLEAVGGEQAGRFCWCKMLHPAVSYWQYYTSYGNVGECISYCAYLCAWNVKSSWSFRENFVSVIAN